LGPSNIDLEIRSLSPEGGGSIEAMEQFLKFCSHVLNSRNNFELVNAYLGLFLKVSIIYILLMFALPDLLKYRS
jgi:U3 small nucleolar RNA-associated protein 21